LRYLVFIFAFLSSCCMYKKEFDCPAGEGVPCTSVSRLEKMIVEAERGDDPFLGCVPKMSEPKIPYRCACTASETPAPFQRRIWIANRGDQPIYIYFDEEECEAP